MKVILSRKGFDSTSGGIPSPIIDNTLIPMPIPSIEDNLTYKDLFFQDKTYEEILHDLAPNRTFNTCHMDPDLSCTNRVRPIDGWSPAFGQVDAAQGILHKNSVGIGDIFLFFGWFRKAELMTNGHYRYVPGNNDFYDSSDLQVIYGYMEVGDILFEQKEIERRYPWHPHSNYGSKRTNTLYLPSKAFSLMNKPSFGILKYDKKRVLTKEGSPRSIWHNPLLIHPNRRNSKEAPDIFYKGRWQELVFEASDKLIEWVKGIISD